MSVVAIIMLVVRIFNIIEYHLTSLIMMMLMMNIKKCQPGCEGMYRRISKMMMQMMLISLTMVINLAARECTVEYPPLRPAPSASDISRSKFAPPVTWEQRT